MVQIPEVAHLQLPHGDMSHMQSDPILLSPNVVVKIQPQQALS
jgi:hypothetical protein